MLLVDLSIIIHRSYHAMDFLKTSKDVPSGMEFGTLRTLKALDKQFKGDMVLCIDNGKEKKEHEFYKANRTKKPASFIDRLKRITNTARQLYRFAEVRDTEADTLMHSISRTGPGPHYLYTNDKDLHQSLTSTTFQIKSHNSKQFVWGPEELWEKYKVFPYQWAIYRALTGDPADNIPKCKGIGASYAAQLVRASWHSEYLNPCSALEHEMETASLSKKQRENWKAFKPQLRINYSLINIPVITVPIYEPEGGSIQDFLDEFEITTIECKETEF